MCRLMMVILIDYLKKYLNIEEFEVLYGFNCSGNAEGEFN